MWVVCFLNRYSFGHTENQFREHVYEYNVQLRKAASQMGLRKEINNN